MGGRWHRHRIARRPDHLVRRWKLTAAAYAAHPERFIRAIPQPPALPTTAWSTRQPRRWPTFNNFRFMALFNVALAGDCGRASRRRWVVVGGAGASAV